MRKWEIRRSRNADVGMRPATSSVESKVEREECEDYGMYVAGFVVLKLVLIDRF
ncbi:hypothetical protein D1BOALGB6SA_6003 [Olavius sp. associated proteobacterium Delta 1]|nr:hypothetical protein D1BOALGB6SA_6003 [Olavius sp. associated proteobacterium Delta 1]